MENVPLLFISKGSIKIVSYIFCRLQLKQKVLTDIANVIWTEKLLSGWTCLAIVQMSSGRGGGWAQEEGADELRKRGSMSSGRGGGWAQEEGVDELRKRGWHRLKMPTSRPSLYLAPRKASDVVLYRMRIFLMWLEH